jgi:hypothetical protein
VDARAIELLEEIAITLKSLQSLLEWVHRDEVHDRQRFEERQRVANGGKT